MDQFVRRTPRNRDENSDKHKEMGPSLKQPRTEVNFEDLPADPGLRPPMSTYNCNDRDQIRRTYLLRGPCQPHEQNYPSTKFGKQGRQFNARWFDEYPSWLEYSTEKDALFCLYCYLFKSQSREQGGDCFASTGFTNWKKMERLDFHVGAHTSAHNQARQSCESLLNQKQHIATFVDRHDADKLNNYGKLLKTSIECVRFLLRQGLAFRGCDESENSSNQGNYLELLKFLSSQHEFFREVMAKAPRNDKLTCSDIQKEMVNACAVETTTIIIKDIGDAFFALLVDEARDVSTKEQMSIILRYVDKKGQVLERFLGIVHVADTCARSLKASVDALFHKHGLSLSRLRGQGYDGASNMSGEFNGLKALIMKDNASAFYIHCFAHQLQLALVAVAKGNDKIALLFHLVSSAYNLGAASCKRREILREQQELEFIKASGNGDILSGRGLNQETSLRRAGDTRWSSHYECLGRLLHLYTPALRVLDSVARDGSNSQQKAEASMLLDSLQSFDFVFTLHMMKKILGYSNDLSLALQRKDQDIVNAMSLVNASKLSLQALRDDGWDALLSEVSEFCHKHEIDVPNMDDGYIARGRIRRRVQEVSNLRHYRADIFYSVIDMQLQELNNRFTEANTELLLCIACLDPSDSFIAFDKAKLIRLAQFYPTDFSTYQITVLDDQLDIYIIDMRSSSDFSGLHGISDLAVKMIEKKKHIVFPLVYLLVKLALTLPVATASVERSFSAMNIIKNRLRNRMGDQWMNDNLVTYIEKDVFRTIETDVIMRRFQSMKTRRGQL